MQNCPGRELEPHAALSLAALRCVFVLTVMVCGRRRHRRIPREEQRDPLWCAGGGMPQCAGAARAARRRLSARARSRKVACSFRCGGPCSSSPSPYLVWCSAFVHRGSLCGEWSDYVGMRGWHAGGTIESGATRPG